MRVEKIKIDDILYEHCEYEESLKQSLLRIGVSFPLHVKLCEQGYLCEDGHKRLSCIHDLLAQGEHEKLQYVPAIITQRARSAPPMYLKNHH